MHRDHFVVSVVVFFVLHENVICAREPLKSWDDIMSPFSSSYWSFAEWAAFETRHIMTCRRGIWCGGQDMARAGA